MSDRMAQLESTSAILGEYMLRGYTLTALTCETCSVTPLMRESAASAAREGRQPIQFCAQCDGRPDAGASSALPAVAAGPTVVEDLYTQAIPTVSQSTPPTLPAPSQADKAADSISSLLLQGYSLLSSNCPNAACRGIPLVGYPKRKDGSKDGRRMCVSCGGAWVDEGDVGGMKVVEKRPAEHDSDEGVAESPRSKARRELYATGTSIVEERARATQVAQVDEAREMDLDLEEEGGQVEAAAASLPTTTKQSNTAEPLAHASDALSTTLHRLASSLERISPGSPDQANAFVNIKLHTEAMKDVLGVLELVKRLQ